MTEERERMIVPIKLKLPNFLARTKMKARQLILEADSSTKSKAAASQRRPNPKVGAKLNVETVVKENEVLVKKDHQTSTVSPTSVVTRRVTRKD